MKSHIAFRHTLTGTLRSALWDLLHVHPWLLSGASDNLFWRMRPMAFCCLHRHKGFGRHCRSFKTWTSLGLCDIYALHYRDVLKLMCYETCHCLSHCSDCSLLLRSIHSRKDTKVRLCNFMRGATQGSWATQATCNWHTVLGHDLQWESEA